MMSGETDLSMLLKSMKPKLQEGDYVFCTVSEMPDCLPSDIIGFFREEEGTTLILKREVADLMELTYAYLNSWIILTVYSSLQAVGLTAAFSKALADHQISCNVIAGYHHDHIFLDSRHAQKALVVLENLSAQHP